MNDVCVTGIGLVTPIGVGRERTWEGLMSGRSGAGPLTAFDAGNQSVRIAAQVDDFDPTETMSAREISRCDRFTQMAVAAAAEAWEQAGLDSDEDPQRIGVIVGSAIGGLGTIESEHDAFLANGPRGVSPFMVPRLMPNAAAGAIAMKLGLNGVNHGVSSACATGAHAIGDAMRCIQQGGADVILAGGTEAALTPLSVAAFSRMGALSMRNGEPTAASRPFDSERDGFVFGEGAGVLVLERGDFARARGAQVIARLTGYGATADAFHVTQPDPNGKGAIAAMEAALEEAIASPADVDHINAHGTSTPHNDRIETVAIKTALGFEAKRIPVSSTKSHMGHLLGAAGAVEAAIVCMTIQHGVVPGTLNLESPDPECDLDYVGDGPREQEVRLALSNSFGFGGQNACLALAAP